MIKSCVIFFVYFYSIHSDNYFNQNDDIHESVDYINDDNDNDIDDDDDIYEDDDYYINNNNDDDDDDISVMMMLKPLLALIPAWTPPLKSAPNIIFILADDLV